MSKTYDELKRAEQSRHAANVVGTDMRVKGDITGTEDLLVDGSVEGLIHIGDGVLTVGASGRIAADVVAREVIVYGEIIGNVAGRERIEIRREGTVVGDLMTARIIIDDGANFKGAMEIVSRIPSAQPLASPLPPSEGDQNGRAFTAAS